MLSVYSVAISRIPQNPNTMRVSLQYAVLCGIDPIQQVVWAWQQV